MLRRMVFSTRCCGCGPKEPVCVSLYPTKVVYELTHSAQDYTPAPQDHSHNTLCWTP